MAKSIVPLKVQVESCQVRTLLAHVYRQVKGLLVTDVVKEKLYLSSFDDFFYPPNALLSEVGISSSATIKLRTCGDLGRNEVNFFCSPKLKTTEPLKKRDEKALTK